MRFGGWSGNGDGEEVWAGEAEPAPDADKLNVVFGGFLDTNYLYDFNRPAGLDRTLRNGSPFSTTRGRANEFNINMAYFEAK